MSRVRSAQLVDGVAIGVSHAAAWEQAYGHIFDSGFLGRAAEGRRVGWSHMIERLLRDDNVLLVGSVMGLSLAEIRRSLRNHSRGAEGGRALE